MSEEVSIADQLLRSVISTGPLGIVGGFLGAYWIREYFAYRRETALVEKKGNGNGNGVGTVAVIDDQAITRDTNRLVCALKDHEEKEYPILLEIAAQQKRSVEIQQETVETLRELSYRPRARR